MYKLLAGQVIFKIFIAILTFINMAIIARWLGVTENGNFALWTNNVAIAIMLVDIGLSQAITYSIAKYNIGHFSFLKKILGISIVQSLLILGMILAFLFYFNTSNREAIWPLTLFASSLIFQNNCIQFFQGNKSFQPINWMQLCQQLLILLVLVIFKNSIQHHITIIYIIGVIQTVLTIGLIIYFIKNQPNHLSKEIAVEWKPFIQVGLILFVTNLIQFIPFRADYWFIDAYTSKSQLGIYAVSSKLIQAFWLIPITIQNFLFPYFSSKDFTEQLTSKIKNIFFICAAIGFIGMLLAPLMIPFIFSEEYKESVIPFEILMLGSIPMILSMMISPYLIAIDKKLLNFYSSLFTAILAIILYFILIPKHGIIGAAIASAIAYSFQGLIAVYFYWSSRRTLNK